jgi:tetratricopeptide (TPR) repeat protein
MALLEGPGACAAPYTPSSDSVVLATVQPGSGYSSAAARDSARTRADVALPLAQFYIARARASGDLRNLGYAEGALTPWILQPSAAQPAALVLHATILQSRHAFEPALAELDRALALQPENAQAWLTRATILRVLGRYPDALRACGHLIQATDPAVTALCEQSVRALTGGLAQAYAAVKALPGTLPPEARAWRDSELGEMAERLGDDTAAEHWLREGLGLAPDDVYLRTALADLLLRHDRAAEALQLSRGYESVEPMMLRGVIAQGMLRQADSGQRELLATAFALEEQRGDAVHRREQARFLLDVEHRPQAALAAAESNWQVQREPEDLLILLRSAQSAGERKAAVPARRFLAQTQLQDVRLAPYLADGPP